MKLDDVIPWGRSLDEYRAMFALSAADLASRILGCGDGPASFNAEATAIGHRVVSCDPIYAFMVPRSMRVYECYPAMIAQVKAKPDNFRWKLFCDPDHLVEYRLAAMRRFLADYETGQVAGAVRNGGATTAAVCRCHVRPRALFPFFVSVFGTLRSGLSPPGVLELLRRAREVCIFPLLDLDYARSAHVEPICEDSRSAGYDVELVVGPYEFHAAGTRCRGQPTPSGPAISGIGRRQERTIPHKPC